MKNLASMLIIALSALTGCAREDTEAADAHAEAGHAEETHADAGRTTIAAAVARDAGIETAVAGPGRIEQTLTLYGTIRPDMTKTREIEARFPGVIRRVHKRIGDRVRSGEALAVVEANESLQSYTISSPIAGTVTQRHAEPGEQTGAAPLFEIVDFSRVWAQLEVFPRDRPRLAVGQRVRVSAEGVAPVEGSLGYIAPFSSGGAQSVIARVGLDNEAGQWTPGQFVEGRVVVEETPVALAVPLSALQTFRERPAVFVQMGETYEARVLELGRRGAEHVEVLGGLEAGTRYVTRNSFLIKADLEKSGASHDH